MAAAATALRALPRNLTKISDLALPQIAFVLDKASAMQRDRRLYEVR